MEKSRRRVVLVLSVVTVGLGADLVHAGPRAEPVDVQGLELEGGRIAATPPAAVWGASARPSDRAMMRLREAIGPVWIAWDAARRVPSGLIPRRLLAPGSIASASRAEAFARALVDQHRDVFAPGSASGDFIVVANERSGDTRTIGLMQHSGGLAVLGGQVSIRFAADRVVLVASQALPDVIVVPTTRPVISAASARARATDLVDRDYPGASSTAADPTGTFVLPIWTGSAWRYHAVVRVIVSSDAPLGRWAVYLDAHAGEPIAREQQMHSAATVRFDVPIRYPAAREDAIAPQLDVTQGGMAATTDLGGQVALTSSPTTIDTTVTGPLVEVTNNAGPEATASFPASDGDTITWSLADDEFGDAQLSGFVHASRVKSYVRGIAPDLAWLDETISLDVNRDGSCNAISDGNQLYFLRAGDCQNTARLADVVHHEFGHSVHGAAIIPGVGAQQGALSEGISDYLAATIVDDSGMGRGFFYNDDPLRELDPPDFEWSWPQDKGESHAEGRIIGGTLWDLREALQTDLGEGEGIEHTDMLWYESIRRAVDIPTMYPEVLAADDDDGVLGNGTPNGCRINEVFQAHGLLDASLVGDLTIDLVSAKGGREVVVTHELPMFDACPFGVGDAELHWRLRDAPDEVTTTPMVLEDGALVATIPTHGTGIVVEYQVELDYDNGASAILPRNPADRWYQTYFGSAIPIYCLDAAADRSAWVFEGQGNTWSFGPLMGGGGIDPADPYDGDGVLLSQDGQYPNNAHTSATGPVIDIAGYDDVRVQYRRWLSVEDGFFDQARIRLNGTAIWQNLTTDQANVHHADGEWRFHDLPIDELANQQAQLQFSLDADGGLRFGGWTVDALCLIQVAPTVCGDGLLDTDEGCDDGNTEDGDGCDASCTVEEQGTTGTDDTGGDETSADDGTSDPGTASIGDSGASITSAATLTTTIGDDDGSSTGDAAQAGSTDDGCGCRSAPNDRAWGVFALGVLIARRRRRW